MAKHAPHGHHGNPHAAELVLAGTAFDDATTALVGGVSPSNLNQVLNDLANTAGHLATWLLNNPKYLGTQTEVDVHRVIENIALEEKYVSLAAGDGGYLGDFVGKGINDVHRDIVDIVEGNPILAKAVGFTPLPPLLNDPVPFADSAEQTQFGAEHLADATFLAGQAVDVVTNGGDFALIEDHLLQFTTNSAEFSLAQSGLYSARFDNELVSNDTSVVKDLIAGLEAHDVGLVAAAAETLVGNAEDFAGNNAPLAGVVVDPNLHLYDLV